MWLTADIGMAVARTAGSDRVRPFAAFWADSLRCSTMLQCVRRRSARCRRSLWLRVRSACGSASGRLRQLSRTTATAFTGHLVIVLFFFQFSFFLWTKLGLFLVFPFAFIPFSLITHIRFSSLKNDLRQLVRLTIAVTDAQFIVRPTRSRC